MNALPPPSVDAVASLRARLWDSGYRPVALKTSDKMPTTREWQDRARRNPPADADECPTTDRLNTGILCDGLRVIDIDIDAPELAHRVRALALKKLGDSLIRTRSGTGRSALLYRASEGTPGKRVLPGKLGKVEVLGKGQQLHAFGAHPSGTFLTWQPEPPDMTPLDTLPAVTEAQLDAFLAACAPLIEAEAPQQAKAPPAGDGHHRSPQGAGADPLDVTAALAVIPNDGPADWEAWNRVGMAAWAATGGSEAGFAAWCAWSARHPDHDDQQARARWQHYPTSPPGSIGAGTLFHLAKQARPGWVKPTEAAKAPPPRPPAMEILHRSATPAPCLPLQVFGPVWGPWTTRAAEGANAPPDYIALPLLALASALLGNARWVVAWPGWAEPPCLWCASVGNPSSGKSSGATPVTRDVLGRVEKWVGRNFQGEMEEWATVADIAQAVMKQWQKDVARAVKMKTELPTKPPEAIPPPKPVRPRVRVADATVEKLASILEGLPKGVLYVRDELAGWLMNMTRYSNGGSDRPFFLEAWNGGPMQVDRVKNPDPVFIPHLTVPIFGTIQPERLADTLGGADDGLTSRFLWAWPQAQPFAQPAHTGDVEAAATNLLKLAELTMATGQDGQQLPSYRHLVPDARVELADFARDMQTRENTAHGLMKSAFGKARGQALRLAIVLEYLWWAGEPPGQPEPQSVSLRAMQAATALMDAYFLPMAARVLGDASVPEDERNARTLATWIIETRPERVNVSSIRDGARLPGLRESDPVKAACRFLVEANWLLEAPLSGAPGRPRGDYITNPLLWGGRQ